QNMKRVRQEFYNAKIIDGKGYDTIGMDKVMEHFRLASDTYLDTKIICYKNIPVNNWNLGIRSHIHFDANDVFVPRDIIYMNNTYVHHPDAEEKIEGGTKWTCYNSDEYLITDVRMGTYRGVHCYILYLDKEGHKHFSHVEDPYLRIVSVQGIEKFNEVKNEKHQLAISAPNSTKEEKHERSLLWKDYYAFVESFGNVSYAYAFTGYKVQGSGYKNVYIDVNDILGTRPITKKRKLQ